jgi:hypothetical protein
MEYGDRFVCKIRFLEQEWADFSFKSEVENSVDIAKKIGTGMDEDGWRF